MWGRSFPTVHSNFKSNMASRINDGEFIALARTNKTPALKASSLSFYLSNNYSRVSSLRKLKI